MTTCAGCHEQLTRTGQKWHSRACRERARRRRKRRESRKALEQLLAEAPFSEPTIKQLAELWGVEL